MLLITTFVELRVVAGRSRTRVGSPQAVSRRTCCALALRRTAWSEHGMDMASVNQTRPHCVNQMGKTHSKPLAARHGHGVLCVIRPLIVISRATLLQHPPLQPLSPHRLFIIIIIPIIVIITSTIVIT